MRLNCIKYPRKINEKDCTSFCSSKWSYTPCSTRVSTASSTLLFRQYANCIWSNELLTNGISLFIIRLFLSISRVLKWRLRDANRSSLQDEIVLGTGTMVDSFHKAGTDPVLIEVWNSVWKGKANWFAHNFKTLLLTPSGPLALWLFKFVKSLRTSPTEISIFSVSSAVKDFTRSTISSFSALNVLLSNLL